MASAPSPVPAPVPAGARGTRIALYCPSLPPARGGVADQTLMLARALAERGAPVVVLGDSGDPALFEPVETVLGVSPSGRTHGLAELAVRASAGAVLIQYVPFLFGRLGIAPSLVAAMRALRRAGVRIAVFVHEPYVPFTRLVWWVTGWPMRLQFRAVVRLADVVYAAVPDFLARARRVARPATRLVAVPVGATIPVAAITRAAARRSLGLAEAEIAVGVFCPRAAGALAGWLARAASRVERVRWIFFGTGSERAPDGFPAAARAQCLGWMSAERASEVFRALDLAAAPFADGLTMRRTSAMAALAHGVPLVSSRGDLFDADLAEAAVCASSPDAFADAVGTLAGDPGMRARQGRRGLDVYTSRASTAVLAARVHQDLGVAA